MLPLSSITSLPVKEFVRSPQASSRLRTVMQISPARWGHLRSRMCAQVAFREKKRQDYLVEWQRFQLDPQALFSTLPSFGCCVSHRDVARHARKATASGGSTRLQCRLKGAIRLVDQKWTC